MKQINLDVVLKQSQQPASFYQRTGEDIVAHERHLSEEIEELQAARQRLLHLKVQLPEVPSRQCVFCGGESRDLSLVIENSDAFVHLGNGALTLEHESYLRPVPVQWECQECGAFDVNTPGEARIWNRDNLPGPRTLSRQMLDAFAEAREVALAETSHDTLWMLQVNNIWYVLPGTGAQIVQRLRSRSAAK